MSGKIADAGPGAPRRRFNPGGITITQPGGAQVTFWPKNGSCPSGYVTVGSYCVVPQDGGASLTANTGISYTFTPAPGGTTYTYNWNGALTAESDPAGDTLTITYNSPAPGTGNCPSVAATCETVQSPSGRALVIGSNSSGQVTSVTDPMSRRWSYTYTSKDLTTVTFPASAGSRVTSYTYGPGTNSNPLLTSDLLTITSPNAQPGGPDAGDATVNVYDNTGRVTRQTDPAGWATTFSYCAGGQGSTACMNESDGTGFVYVTDPDGNTASYGYTAGGLTSQAVTTGTTVISEQDQGLDLSGGTMLPAWTADGNANITTYNSYDGAGDPRSTTAPAGNGQPGTTTSWYTSLSQSSCDANPQAASPCSASQTGPTAVAPGGVISPPSSAPPQGVTYTLYDTDGNQLYASTGVYPPGGSTAAYTQTTYTLYAGNSITLGSSNISCNSTPPSQSLPCATINPDGVVTQLGYDSAGDLTSSTAPDGNGTELATTTYGYNGDGEQTSAVTPDGNLSGANAANYTATTAWNADSEQTSVTQAGGTGATVTPRTTNYGYDANGNKTTVQNARGYTTTTTYNADNRSVLITDPLGNAALTCYDGNGNITQTVPPAGVAANSLTPASCPSAYPSGYGNRLASDATTWTYDAHGNKTAMTTPAPAGQTGHETTTYTYDGNGNMLTTTSPPATGTTNEVTTDTYNSANQLATETTGSGTSVASTTTYCYDQNGDQTAVVMPDGNTSGTAPCETSYPWVVSSTSYPTQAAYQTTSAYDSAGELVSTTSPVTSAAPAGATTAYTFDAAANMLTRTDPNGVTTTWTYTPLNLTATISYSGSSAHSVSYTYDANEQRTAMTDATGSSSYAWDPFGELTSVQNGAGKTVGYSYDADGNTIGITYPLPGTATWATTSTVGYGYNHADVLTSVTDFNGHQTTITPNADSLPSSIALGSTGDTISTTYDPTDSPSAIALKNSSTTLQSFTYADAPAGNINSETDTPTSSNSPAAYTYDARSRVASMTPGTNSTLNYGFDASSNLTTTPVGASGNYDKAGELTSSVLVGTTTNYAYDADGQRLTSKQGSTTITSGTWNGAGRLTAYSNSAANMTAASYDGNGLRAAATTSSVTQAFTWNTTTSVPELLMDSGNAYIYGTAGTPPEQVNLSTGTITYLVVDSLGSIRGTVNSTGTLTGTTAYDAWGNPETAGGLTSTTPFGFAGGYTDPTGLIYLTQRYYDPATGQFISLDPLVAQTMTPYGYADGNPVSNIDPTGADSWHWAESDLATWGSFIGYYQGIPIGIPAGDMFIAAEVKQDDLNSKYEDVYAVDSNWGTFFNIQDWSVRWVFRARGGGILARLYSGIHHEYTGHGETWRYVIDSNTCEAFPRGTVIDGVVWALDTQLNIRHPINAYPHMAHLTL